jgi:(2Fe-2S) ferredoxin
MLVCCNDRPPGSGKPSCAPRGGEAVLSRYKECVRELGLHETVMVARTGFLKHCTRGITAAIWPYGLRYQRARPGGVDEIVEKSVVGEGREVERLRMPDIPWE